jgi:hypothetical protein
VAGQQHPVPAWRHELLAAPIDATAKLVGLALSAYMDGAGRAQVSRSTIARGCSLADVSTVKRAVHRLEVAGYLGIDRGGGQDVSRYQLRSNGGWPAPAAGATAPPVVGAGAPPGGGWNGPVPGAAAPPKVEGQKTSAHARAPEGWLPEDDSEIAAIQAQRERDAAAAKVKSSSEGWGSEEARQRAAEALSFAEQLNLGYRRKGGET